MTPIALTPLCALGRCRQGSRSDDPSGAERWQILSPVRRDVWGCTDLNRWVQTAWRGHELRSARSQRGWVRPFGPQEIIRLDKVILLQNGERSGWEFGPGGGRVSEYLANGESASGPG